MPLTYSRRITGRHEEGRDEAQFEIVRLKIDIGIEEIGEEAIVVERRTRPAK